MPDVAQPHPSRTVPQPQAAIHSSSTLIHVPPREKERAGPQTSARTIPSPPSSPSPSPSSSKIRPRISIKMPFQGAASGSTTGSRTSRFRSRKDVSVKVQGGNERDEVDESQGNEGLGKERSEGDERDAYNDDSDTLKGSTDVASLGSTIAIGTGIARTVLETLREVAKYTPVPFLSEAAQLALGVFDAVERAQGNRGDLRILAEECINLVYIINCAFGRENSLSNHGPNPNSSLQNIHQASDPKPEKLVIPEELKKDLEKVRDTLKPIDKFVKKQARRNTVSRIVMGSKDAEDIKVYQRRVEQAMRAFSFKSNIEQRQILHGLANASTLLKSKIPPSSSSPLVAEPLEPRERTLSPESLESPKSPINIDNFSTTPLVAEPLGPRESTLSPESLEPPKSPINIDNLSTIPTSPNPPKTASFFENASLTNMAPGALTINNVAGDWHQNLGQSPSHLFSQNPFQPDTDTNNSNNNFNSHSTTSGIVLNSGNTWNANLVNSGNRNVVWTRGNSAFGYHYHDEPNVQRHSYHYQPQGVPADRNPFSQSNLPLSSSSSISSSPLSYSPSPMTSPYIWPRQRGGSDWPPTGTDWDPDRHDDRSHSRSWSVTDSFGNSSSILHNNARGRQ